MKDERLEAGRFHLGEGERALVARDLGKSRDHFESAVLQFAGPDLKMGEGQALRGLASVAMAERNLSRAESLLHGAVGCFRTVRSLLDALDDTGVASSHRIHALEAEASVQVTLGELYLRLGRMEEAHEARDWARAAFDGVGDRPSKAGVWSLTAHLAAREGELDEARVAWKQQLAIHERHQDLRGQAGAVLSLAEVARLTGELDDAQELQQRAVSLARQLGDTGVEARALLGLGLIARQQGEYLAAVMAWDAAMKLAQELGDRQTEGFCELDLGEIRSRAAKGQPVQHFRRAVEAFADESQDHALGTALLHAAEHAIRLGAPDLAVPLADGARRIWRTLDPTRGVGHSLRVLVRALADDAPPEALLLLTVAREQLVGQRQPHAGVVADHYRERVSSDDLVRVEALDDADRRGLVEEYLLAVVTERLVGTGLVPSDLGTTRAALLLLDRLGAVPDDRDLESLDASDLEPLPDDASFYVLHESDLLPGSA